MLLEVKDIKYIENDHSYPHIKQAGYLWEDSCDGISPSIMIKCQTNAMQVILRMYGMSRKGDCWDNSVAESFLRL